MPVSESQAVLDEGRTLVLAQRLVLDAPLFLPPGSTIRGDSPEAMIDAGWSGHGVIIGWRRGLVSDAHYPADGVFRTCGDAVALSVGGEWDQGPYPGGWPSVSRFAVKATITKHWPGQWSDPWGWRALAGINAYDEGWGPRPSPWVLSVEGNWLKLHLRTSDGAIRTFTQGVDGSASQIVVDFDVDLETAVAPGTRLHRNRSTAPFGLGLAPAMPGSRGYWGDHGGTVDMTFHTFSLWFNGVDEKRVIGGRPSADSQLPLLTTWGGWNRSLLIHHDSQGLDDAVMDVTIRDVTLKGFPGHAIVNVGAMQGGFGLRLRNVRINGGMRGIQSLGSFVHYPLSVIDCHFIGQSDCNFKLYHASGVDISGTKMDYGVRCAAELVGCQAVITGPLMMAPPSPAQEAVFVQRGGWVRYSGLIANYEYEPQVDAFLHLEPATYGPGFFMTEARLECSQSGFGAPAVRVLPRQAGYVAETLITVSGGRDQERRVLVGGESLLLPDGVTLRL